MKRFLLPFLLLALASGCDSCNDTEGDEAAENTETEPTPPPVEPIEAPEVNMDKVYLLYMYDQRKSDFRLLNCQIQRFSNIKKVRIIRKMVNCRIPNGISQVIYVDQKK